MDFGEIFSDFFWAAAGAGLGTIFGVWFNEREKADSRNKEKARLRQNLIDSFEFNLVEIDKMINSIETKSGERSVWIPDNYLDSESVTHVLFHGKDLFCRCQFDKFNWQRYQIMHINAKIDFVNVATSRESYPSSGVTLLQDRFSSLVNHLRATSRDLRQILSDYKQNPECEH
jgi:hypothetical protein